jgi:hypothetical protein
MATTVILEASVLFLPVLTVSLGVFPSAAGLIEQRQWQTAAYNVICADPEHRTC